MDAHQNPIVATVNFRTLSTLLLSPLALYPVISAVALGSSVYVTFINGPVCHFNSIPSHFTPSPRSELRSILPYRRASDLRRDRVK